MRRRSLLAAVPTVATAFAGCLNDRPTENDPGSNPSDGDGSDDDSDESNSNGQDPDADSDEENRDDEDESEPNEANYVVSLEEDPSEASDEYVGLSVGLEDARVTPESPAVLTAEIANATDGTIAVTSGAPSPFGVVRAEPVEGDGSVVLWTDAYEETSHVSTDGKRVVGVEDVGASETLHAGETIARRFELRGERPALEPGTYEVEVGCGVEPEAGGEGDSVSVTATLAVESAEGAPCDGDDASDDAVVPEDPRVDEPPYPIETPETPDEPAERDEWNDDYLGEELAGEPTLEFEPIESAAFVDGSLDVFDGDGSQYAVHLVEDECDVRTLVDDERMTDDVRAFLDSIDFEDQVLVAVESGYGSSSVQHRWKRVEDDEGVHLHGYHTNPYVQTSDLAPRQSAVAVDRPAEDVDIARVSLTVSEDRRVHVNSTEGVVTVEK